MSEFQRKAYRERLKPGDTVYFVEIRSKSPLDYDRIPKEAELDHGVTDDPLVVKKGIVNQTITSKGQELARPYISVGKLADLPVPLVTSKSPRAVFKPDEVATLLNERLIYSDVIAVTKVEDLIEMNSSNEDLVGMLGGEVINRMANDFVRNPEDPEV